VSALLGVGLVITSLQFARLNDEFRGLIEHDVPLASDAQAMERLVVLIQSSKRAYLLTGSDEFLAEYQAALRGLRVVLARVRRETRRAPAETALVDRFERAVGRYVAESAEPEIALRQRITAGQAPLTDVARAMREGPGHVLGMEALDAARGLYVMALRSVDTQHTVVLVASGTSRRVAVAAMVLSLLGAIAYGIVLARDLGMALSSLRRSIEAMGKGRRRPVDHREDEIGAVAKSFEEMADRLQEAEASLRHKVEEQAHTLEALQETNVALGRAMRVKSDFLATMSHELRTPLNAVIGLSAFLLDSPAEELSPRARQALATMRGSGEHLLELLNDLLDLAKVDAGRMSLAPVSTELAPLVRGCVATVLPLLGDKALEVTLDFSPGCERVVADPHRLRQVLLNLLANAVKFTDRGYIKVRLRRHEDKVLIEVEDTGIGIPPEEVPELFEAFHQGHTGDARRYGGTGLGLALSRRLARAMRGEITVAAGRAAGTVFTVELPAVEAA
jgi:signal transduction histidine kinase